MRRQRDAFIDQGFKRSGASADWPAGGSGSIPNLEMAGERRHVRFDFESALVALRFNGCGFHFEFGGIFKHAFGLELGGVSKGSWVFGLGLSNWCGLSSVFTKAQRHGAKQCSF